MRSQQLALDHPAGSTTRALYLPAGCDWYNYWTNERVHGGQIVTVAAPVDTLPNFVEAGSIVPFGSEIESTRDEQKIVKLKVYPGADAEFTLYNDDGVSYGYEKGEYKATKLHWDDVNGRLLHEGAEQEVRRIEVVGK